jgi:hypothetical protein
MNRHLKRILISGVSSIVINLLILVPPLFEDLGRELSPLNRAVNKLLIPASWFTGLFFPGHTSAEQIVFGLGSSFAFYAIVVWMSITLWVWIRNGSAQPKRL